LVRRLANTTAHEEEVSAERIRGSILWSRTVVERAATGMRHLYVTAPARRAYQTPENELLVHVLDNIVLAGRATNWSTRGTGPAEKVASRVAAADYWRQHRVLADIQRRPVTPRNESRVRAGRHRRAYTSTLNAYRALRALVQQLDRQAVRDAVENR